MNRLVRFLLVTACGTLAIGCGPDEPAANGRPVGDSSRPTSQPPKPQRDVMEYITAEVKIIYGPLADRTKRIEDQAEIQRLLSFFPGAGRGRKGPEPPAPWKNAWVVDFTRADGAILTVTTSFDFWSEGHREGRLWFWSEKGEEGDYLLLDADADEFRTYLRKLFKEDGKP